MELDQMSNWPWSRASVIALNSFSYLQRFPYHQNYCHGSQVDESVCSLLVAMWFSQLAMGSSHLFVVQQSEPKNPCDGHYCNDRSPL